MKTRQGYVSNSSTASFVLLGFDYSKQYDAMPEEEQWAFDEDILCNIPHIYDGEGGAPSGYSCILGEFLMYVSSDSWPDESSEMVDVEEVTRNVERLRERFGATTEIKLWKGTMLT